MRVLFLILMLIISSSLAAQESSYIQPKQIIQKAKGHYFIDFGKAAFGRLILMPQKDSLVVHVGEKLAGPDSIDRNPGGTIRYQRLVVRGNTATFAYNKRNENPPAIILPDSFGRVLPFRYVELENVQVPVKVKQKVFNYRFNDHASSFTSSDTVLNQVWDMCKHTIKATSFAGLYIDGDRERIPYEADAYINQLSHYAVDNEYTLARRTNEYFIDHPTWPTEWTLHTVLLFYADYLYTGNTTAIAKHYEALKQKTLLHLAREDGLIGTDSSKKNDIVDWPPAERDGYEMMKINTVVNAFHYINLKLMADIAGVLDKKQDSVFFYQRSVLVKNSINQKLLKGIYVDGEGSAHSSLHANMFPLAFGIVPEENIKDVVAFIKSRGMACSVYGAQYLLEALYQHGEANYAFQLMTTTQGDRNWWNMIRLGSTMTLEAWDIKYKPNLDWNHAWGTAPANIIARYVWGITPAKPGFARVLIKPQLSTLTSSKIKLPTIRGTIYAEYKNKTFIIELPKGMEGEIVLPSGRFPLKAGRNVF